MINKRKNVPYKISWKKLAKGRFSTLSQKPANYVSKKSTLLCFLQKGQPLTIEMRFTTPADTELLGNSKT